MNRKFFLFFLIALLLCTQLTAQSALLPKDGNRLYDSYLKKYTLPYELKHIAAIWERAEFFVPFIEARIKEQGLPHEVLYLPFVESNFKPDAV